MSGYYVSVVDGSRYFLALGPFGTHEEALRHVDWVRAECFRLDGRSPFWAYGTCRVDRPEKTGTMNKMFGAIP